MVNRMSEYHNINSCNKCKGGNLTSRESFIDWHICEAVTKCSECGFDDYWAYGFFESGSEMESNCEKYSNTKKATQ